MRILQVTTRRLACCEFVLEVKSKLCTSNIYTPWKCVSLDFCKLPHCQCYLQVLSLLQTGLFTMSTARVQYNYGRSADSSLIYSGSSSINFSCGIHSVW